MSELDKSRHAGKGGVGMRGRSVAETRECATESALQVAAAAAAVSGSNVNYAY